MIPEIYCVRAMDGAWLVRCRHWRGEPFTLLSTETQAEAERQVERWRLIALEAERDREEVRHV